MKHYLMYEDPEIELKMQLIAMAGFKRQDVLKEGIKVFEHKPKFKKVLAMFKKNVEKLQWD